jgi:beta-galactosidase/beta-glucuronidase
MPVARPEYPRPHFDRSHSWSSLNGAWDFAPDPTADGEARGLVTDDAAWQHSINVPFAWETPASGIGLHWLACGWYRRSLQIDPAWSGQRVVLHFGAVHHQATVWVNGGLAGSHEGGYTPFELDITDALDNGCAVVVVRVEAPVDKRFIAHGKQRSIPRDDYDGCSFTPSSGIWQSVWLEARPATHLSLVALTPRSSLDGFDVEVHASGAGTVRLEILGGAGEVEAELQDGTANLVLPVDSPRLWQTTDPHSYQVVATLVSDAGTDRVTVSSGLREVRIEGGNILLNGERLYVRGVLDQGYWPETGITAPTDEAFVADIRLAAEAGFNLVRKHLKLEDPRFLHHADRLGMLVWGEPASTGRFTPEAVERFEAQIEPMVQRDGNHPSIVFWGLYNEEWGLDWDVPGDPAKKDAVRSAYRQLKDLDRSRPVVDNSGWTHVETDLVDWHVYDEQPAGWADKVKRLLSDGEDRFPVAIAVDKVVDKLLMAEGGPAPAAIPNLNSEYGGGYTSVDRGWNLRWQTQELRRYDRLAGYVWTELYDIEHETAGIFGFHRERKDQGGNIAARSHAETVLVTDVTPVHPGQDLVLTDRTFSFGVQISSHASKERSISLRTAWAPHLSDVLPALPAEDGTAAQTLVEPFVLSRPVIFEAQLPAGLTAARLYVLAVAEGTVIASTCLDVGLAD